LSHRHRSLQNLRRADLIADGGVLRRWSKDEFGQLVLGIEFGHISFLLR
jgi:hypothetical protein